MKSQLDAIEIKKKKVLKVPCQEKAYNYVTVVM